VRDEEKTEQNQRTVDPKIIGSLGYPPGCVGPDFDAPAVGCAPIIASPTGYCVPNPAAVGPKTEHCAVLDGNFARRRHRIERPTQIFWHVELKGFGLRVTRGRAGGYWLVRLRSRGRDGKKSLGSSRKVAAPVARARARAMLASVALDGLPERPKTRPPTLFAVFATEFTRDYARHWKPSTQATTASYCRRWLVPTFGTMDVAAIDRADIRRWRDGFAGKREGSFNRVISILSAMFGYAEQLGYRRRGSNPCRGIAQFKRVLPQRYLTPSEHRRLGEVLALDEVGHAADVAIIRLLLYTGARRGEIVGLTWREVQPPRLHLADSKTGPKLIYLNPQAEAVLAAVPRRDGCPIVFPNRRGNRPRNVDPYWVKARREAALTDVRLHDLRHSFASTAIMGGVPLATIGRLLGHALPETTARYAHLADEIVADAAERISGSLARCLGLAA